MCIQTNTGWMEGTPFFFFFLFHSYRVSSLSPFFQMCAAISNREGKVSERTLVTWQTISLTASLSLFDTLQEFALEAPSSTNPMDLDLEFDELDALADLIDKTVVSMEKPKVI